MNSENSTMPQPRLCACGCGTAVKSETATYTKGHIGRDPRVKEKKKKTCMIRYNVDNPFKSEIFKRKIKDTNLIQHGHEYNSQSENVKIKKKNTMLKNHGKENPSQVLKFQEMKKETWLIKYNVDNPFKSEIVKEKSRQTCLKNLGVEHPGQSEIVKQKSKSTLLKKHGVDNWSKTEDGKLQHRETAIRYTEKQKLNGDRLCPRKGDAETPCIDELKNYSFHPILTNKKIIGYFPDGFIEELKLDIEYDEPGHEYPQNKIDDQKRDNSFTHFGYHVFRIKEMDWISNKDSIIHQFKQLISNLATKKNGLYLFRMIS